MATVAVRDRRSSNGAVPPSIRPLSSSTCRWPSTTRSCCRTSASRCCRATRRSSLAASGSGKSTILKLILGLLKPDGGAIWVNGQRVDTMPEQEMMKVRADIGMVFQEGALFDSLTVAENVGYKLYEETDMPLEEVAPARRGSARLRRARASTSTGCRRSCRADSGAASRSPAPWPTSRRCCSTTRRRPGSIRSPRRRSTRRSSSCATSKNVSSIVVTHQLRDAFFVATHEAVRQGSNDRDRAGRRAEVRRGGVHHAEGRVDRASRATPPNCAPRPIPYIQTFLS